MGNGVCFTGAIELILAADFIIAGRKKASFCDTHSKLGLVPTWGLAVRLPRRIGLGNAKMMSFTGRRFSADDAHKIGLVDMVVEDAELLNAAHTFASEMAQNSTDSIRKQKRMMDMAYMASGREALAWLDDVRGFHPGHARDMKERMQSLFGAGKGNSKGGGKDIAKGQGEGLGKGKGKDGKSKL